MSYVPLERLIEKTGPSLFKLVLVSATRANELAQGAQPLVKSDAKKVSTVAMEEIASGKVHYEDVKVKGKKSAS